MEGEIDIENLIGFLVSEIKAINPLIKTARAIEIAKEVIQTFNLHSELPSLKVIDYIEGLVGLTYLKSPANFDPNSIYADPVERLLYLWGVSSISELPAEETMTHFFLCTYCKLAELISNYNDNNATNIEIPDDPFLRLATTEVLYEKCQPKNDYEIKATEFLGEFRQSYLQFLSVEHDVYAYTKGLMENELSKYLKNGDSDFTDNNDPAYFA